MLPTQTFGVYNILYSVIVIYYSARGHDIYPWHSDCMVLTLVLKFSSPL